MDSLSDQIFSITRLDREIDALVYELYGLTEEEIRIEEGVKYECANKFT